MRGQCLIRLSCLASARMAWRGCDSIATGEAASCTGIKSPSRQAFPPRTPGWSLSPPNVSFRPVPICKQGSAVNPPLRLAHESMITRAPAQEAGRRTGIARIPWLGGGPRTRNHPERFLGGGRRSTVQEGRGRVQHHPAPPLPFPARRQLARV